MLQKSESVCCKAAAATRLLCSRTDRPQMARLNCMRLANIATCVRFAVSATLRVRFPPAPSSQKGACHLRFTYPPPSPPLRTSRAVLRLLLFKNWRSKMQSTLAFGRSFAILDVAQVHGSHAGSSCDRSRSSHVTFPIQRLPFLLAFYPRAIL